MTMREAPRRKQARRLLRRHGYAVGGHVKEVASEAAPGHARPTLKSPRLSRPKRSAADGAAPAQRADKPRRAAGGKAGKAGTKVIILNNHPQPMPVPRPVPVPVPMRAAPPAMPGRPPLPMAAPPALPPGAAPRPPMARRGGRA
jgi:hypothetical protein